MLSSNKDYNPCPKQKKKTQKLGISISRLTVILLRVIHSDNTITSTLQVKKFWKSLATYYIVTYSGLQWLSEISVTWATDTDQESFARLLMYFLLVVSHKYNWKLMKESDVYYIVQKN